MEVRRCSGGSAGTVQTARANSWRRSDSGPAVVMRLPQGLTEVIGGLLLAIGLFTPLAAAVIASVMLVAAVTVHWKNGFFITSGGYEFNLVLGVVALSVAFTGPGALSLDGIIGFAPVGAAWGVGAAVVAVLGAIGQLAQRRPSPDSNLARRGRLRTPTRTEPAARVVTRYVD